MEINFDKVSKLKKLNELFDNLDYPGVFSLSNEMLIDYELPQDVAYIIEVNQILSKVYHNMGDYAKAFEYALEAAEHLDQTYALVPSLENINCLAKVLIKSNSNEDAIKLLKKGLKMANKNDKSQQVAFMFNLIGRAYMGLKQYDIAEGYLKNALDIALKNNYISFIPEIKINIAQLNVYKGVFNIAKTFIDEAMISAKDENQVIFITWCYILNANIAFERKNYQATIEFAKKAESLADKYGLYQELACSYEWLFKVYPKLNEYEKAFEASQKYIFLQKEISSKEKEIELYKMRAKYDYYQHQKEMKALKANYEKVTQQRQELQYLMDVLGRQNEELLSIAINDFLTGTYNRKYFMLKFEEEFSIADEHGRDISCLVFDIDKFKGINDTYGHLAGDEVIKHVVDVCSSVTDSKDIIGRFGGDEFVIILMGKGIVEACDIGNTILDKLRQSPMRIENHEIVATISLGVTDNIIGHPNNAEDMIRVADKALYKAKDNGRNQLCVAENTQQDYDYLK